MLRINSCKAKGCSQIIQIANKINESDNYQKRRQAFQLLIGHAKSIKVIE